MLNIAQNFSVFPVFLALLSILTITVNLAFTSSVGMNSMFSLVLSFFKLEKVKNET